MHPHRLVGECRCGVQHGLDSAPVDAPTLHLNGHSADHTNGVTLHARREITAEVAYRIGDFEHVRREYNDHSKTFSWRGLDGSTGLSGTAVADLPLYGAELLPETPAGQTVIVTEGEKACDALLALGVRAVATVTGAKSCPSPDSLAVLRGFDVMLWPDNDDVGREHMQKVGASLVTLGIVCHLVDWKDAPLKGDAADWCERGGTIPLLAEIVDAATEVRSNGRVSRVQVKHAADLMHMVMPDIRWAIPDVFPEGVALLAGKSKLGKSWLILDACLAVARGEPAWGSVRCEVGDVLYLALEDSRRRLKSRLATLLGSKSPGRLDYETNWPRADEGGIEEIVAWLEGHPEARLVVIDTLKKFRPQEANTKRLYDTDYEAIAPIADVAGQRGVCIAVIHHTNKMNPEDPIDSVSGTTGLVGAADMIGIFRRERGKADASLLITGRDVDEHEIAFKRTLDLKLGQKNPGHAWEMIGDAEEMRISDQQQALIDLLQKRPGLKPWEIAEEMDLTRNAAGKIARRMVDGGKLRDRDGRYYAP